MTNKTGIKQTAWIVPPSSAVQCVNDARHCVENRTIVEERRLQPCRENVDFENSLCLNGTKNLAESMIKRLRFLETISAKEEFYANHGDSYTSLA